MDLTKIPNDIIINHIIPFTYEVQSKILLKDIQSFYKDYEIVINYYSFDLYTNAALTRPFDGRNLSIDNTADSLFSFISCEM